MFEFRINEVTVLLIELFVFDFLLLLLVKSRGNSREFVGIFGGLMHNAIDIDFLGCGLWIRTFRRRV